MRGCNERADRFRRQADYRLLMKREGARVVAGEGGSEGDTNKPTDPQTPHRHENKHSNKSENKSL